MSARAASTITANAQVFGKNLFQWPSSPESMLNSLWAKFEMIGPIYDAHRFSMKLDHSAIKVARSVIGLLFRSSPAAVFWAIVSIYVNAIERIIAFRWMPHICKEAFKGIQPSITNFYTSSAIAIVLVCVWCIASIFHGFPTAICTSISLSVRDAPFHSDINCEASTTSPSVSYNRVPQIIACVKADVPTVAKAFPDNQIFAGSSSKANDSQAFKSLTCEIQNSVIEFRKRLWLAMINNSHERFLAYKGSFRLGLQRCWRIVADRFILTPTKGLSSEC